MKKPPEIRPVLTQEDYAAVIEALKHPMLRDQIVALTAARSNLEAEKQKVERQGRAIADALRHQAVSFVRVVARLIKDGGIYCVVLVMVKVTELVGHALSLAPSTTAWFGGLHVVAMFATLVILAFFGMLDVVEERRGHRAAE